MRIPLVTRFMEKRREAEVTRKSKELSEKVQTLFAAVMEKIERLPPEARNEAEEEVAALVAEQSANVDGAVRKALKTEELNQEQRKFLQNYLSSGHEQKKKEEKSTDDELTLARRERDRRLERMNVTELQEELARREQEILNDPKTSNRLKYLLTDDPKYLSRS